MLQDTHSDLLFFVQRVSNKPYDAPSFAQQRLRANPNSWLAYKRLPGPSWKHFAKHKVRCHSQTCCKIPMRICSFSFIGCPTSQMMHRALRSKDYVPIRIAGWIRMVFRNFFLRQWCAFILLWIWPQVRSDKRTLRLDMCSQL